MTQTRTVFLVNDSEPMRQILSARLDELASSLSEMPVGRIVSSEEFPRHAKSETELVQQYLRQL